MVLLPVRSWQGAAMGILRKYYGGYGTYAPVILIEVLKVNGFGSLPARCYVNQGLRAKEKRRYRRRFLHYIE
jgi:hypothetical protein